MKSNFILIICFIFAISLSSCKADKKNTDSKENSEEQVIEDNAVKKPLENNIFNKVAATSELSTMRDILDSLQLKNELVFEDGPFTIFAVKDEVFHSFLKKDSLFSAIKENNEEWKNIMTTYILKEGLSTVNIYQNIKKNGGVFHAETSSGKHLKFYLINDDIVVEGPKGLTSKIGKSDILATNGILHIIDNLIGSH